MLCREALWNGKQSDEDLVAMLLGYKPLPWEANPAYLSQRVHSHAAAHLVRHLLRCPYLSTSSVMLFVATLLERCHARKLSTSTFFQHCFGFSRHECV